MGVLWQSNDDVFTFRFIPPSANEVFTKRKVASLVAKMFDPFQVLAPYSIRAKVMLQQIWLRGIGWDDPLLEDLSLSWTDWLKHLPKLEKIRLNRCLTQSGKQVNAANIHTFVDASEVAYVTTSYLRQQYISGEVFVSFIAAKSRVAPLKVISVPRLELKGAVIGLRLSRFLGQSLQIPVNKHICWSDSQNVIYWIRNESRSFKPFVANRIGEIHESTFPEQWRHIPGKLNPSDKATRGLSADEFVKDTTWLYGPSFLYEDQSKCPEQHYDVPEDAVKEKRSVSESYSTLLSEPWICCEKFSKLLKAKHVVAWCLRFINNIKDRREERQLGELSVCEIQKAEQILIGFAQKEGFPHEIMALKLGHPLPAKSPLRQLNPVLDSDGLLHMKGRSELAKHLPAKHHITTLIVAHHHEQRNHGAGTNHVLSDI